MSPRLDICGVYVHVSDFYLCGGTKMRTEAEIAECIYSTWVFVVMG